MYQFLRLVSSSLDEGATLVGVQAFQGPDTIIDSSGEDCSIRGATQLH